MQFRPIFAANDGEILNPAAFDVTARGYDQEFTETAVGRAQRAITHRFLSDLIQQHSPKTALELNCGTGEDALWLSKKGLLVTATDLSAEMVEVTTQKTVGQGVRILQSSIQDIGRTLPHERYDLIFSNFGGYNCLRESEIVSTGAAIHRLLRPGGHFVAVVMGRVCAWEIAYFLAKFKWGTAFRRFGKGPVQARLAEGSYQDTYYYTPSHFEHLHAVHLKPVRRLDVGAYLPPSYLDPFFAKRPKLLARMDRWETRAYHQRFPASFSDHFLVAFQRK